MWQIVLQIISTTIVKKLLITQMAYIYLYIKDLDNVSVLAMPMLILKGWYMSLWLSVWNVKPDLKRHDGPVLR